jgi:CelD/BcsL family acetyltransferase involved in cellulose biosynthesis
MNVAIRINSTQGLSGADTASGAERIARIEFFDTLSSVEGIWRQLERNDAVRTPYQSYDFLSPWQRHIGEPTGVTPCLVVGFDRAGKPAFLLPMGRTRKGPLNVLGFLGGKHANFNLGIWRRDILGHITADDIRAVLG